MSDLDKTQPITGVFENKKDTDVKLKAKPAESDVFAELSSQEYADNIWAINPDAQL